MLYTALIEINISCRSAFQERQNKEFLALMPNKYLKTNKKQQVANNL